MARSSRSSSRPDGRLFVLLVMTVLTGLLGMHGLAPGVTPAAHTGAGHERVMTPAGSAPHAGGACAHTDGGSGHLDHADATCAAAGTASAYSPPTLAGDVLNAPLAASPTAAAMGAPQDGRAPPDLSELQLLRI
ncbi:DUF6153 family protein [Streptomyces lancefieldiae]|uniref:DUF6153 family protein n=1 Tax=Streptomyces lancefieldiae TaxID=3075520 RepID=A0ABU3ATZ1_9ACTN|nr:DUF6153 family protein [Streptomyces sp. DSM 40712]MDT0613645.1 DUF6153 family protein [Streptomyces sp. DSM 40712]